MFCSIVLRSLSEEDFVSVLKWSKDVSFCTANGWELNRNEGELYNWWLRCVNNPAKEFLRMGIEYQKELVGYVDLAYIQGNEAEIGIVIGDSKRWGRGLGYQSTLCLIDYASRELGISVFTAETHEANSRSRRMLEKIGFKEVSRNGQEEYLGISSQLIQYKFYFRPDLRLSD